METTGSPISHRRQLKQTKPYDQRRIPFPPNLSSLSPSSPHTWFSIIGCAVALLRTSHPSGSRPCRLATLGPWLPWQPQKTFCSLPRPINALRQADRTGLWLCTNAIQPLVAHGTGATNSLRIRVGSARSVQSGLMVLPTTWRHCCGRPIKRFLIQRPLPRRRACRPS